MVLDQPLDDEIEGMKRRVTNIRHLLQLELQDAQTRLFFKAQAVIQSDIRYYAPTAQDLAYLDRLAGKCYLLFSIFAKGLCSCPGRTTIYEIREKQSISRLFEGPGLNQRETWYPTLAKTVWELCDFVQASHLRPCDIHRP
jgi:hypothetical protein